MKNPVVVFGLSGSGKSFLSRILHEDMGYRWLRSDVIRKELAGIDPYHKAVSDFGEGIYTEDMTRRVYEEMLRRAKELVERGERVVLDATFLKRWQREAVKELFPNAFFILAVAEEEEIKRRLKDRRDVSDADYEIYLAQKRIFEPPQEVEVVEINTQRSREDLKALLKDLLED